MSTNPDGTLRDLKLIHEGTVLWFECPNPGCEHITAIPIAPGDHGYKNLWSMTGELPNMTVHPSIRDVPMKMRDGNMHGCAAHFWIKGGKVEFCGDSGVGGKPH